jgi:hypothetical protein
MSFAYTVRRYRPKTVLPPDAPSPSPCHPISGTQPPPRDAALFRANRSIVVNISHEEENQMNDELLMIVEPEVLSWPGVTSEPGRFGACEYSLPMRG